MRRVAPGGRRAVLFVGLAALCALPAALSQFGDLVAGGARLKKSPGGESRSSAVVPASVSPWRSREGCDRALLQLGAPKSVEGRSRASAERRASRSRVRIGSWNLRWFPDGRADGPARGGGTDVDWMACVIAQMQVQVLAVQELVQHLRGRRALLDLLGLLDRLTGGRWQASFDNCPDDGRQHVGLMFDTRRVQASALRSLATVNPGPFGCSERLRPGFAGYLRFAGGADLHLINVHLDGGIGRRDFLNRQTSRNRLASALGQLGEMAADSDVVLLGDFNTMGCRRCRPPVSAEYEIRGLAEAVSSGGQRMRRLKSSQPCSEYHRGKPALLDHVLVSAGMQELAHPVAEVHGLCAELSCAELGSAKVAVLGRLSDHCPVVVELHDQDRD